eukprot:TRINITY_DN9783_c0_g1_i1.p1 TRINITY_DN9783_c0_g1~~TRINITY_DN9783_c0_g1_i1.p1  ORF type:complete len:151 (-),score=60.73 TRINITY_DN9783_c0_g1_i1:104-556(-)
MEKGYFEIIHKGRREKFTTTNKLDAKFLGSVFDENSESITGLRTQDGKTVGLEEENFAQLVDGKVNTIVFKESGTKKRVQQVERFFSLGKGGEGATGAMNAWLAHPSHFEYDILDRQFYIINENKKGEKKGEQISELLYVWVVHYWKRLG